MPCSGAAADAEADADAEDVVVDDFVVGFGVCFPVSLDLDLPWGACESANKSPMLGVWAVTTAELLRPLLGLALVAGGAVMTSSSGFFGGAFPIDCDAALLGGGGGVGGNLRTDFVRTGGGGVGTGGLLAPAACVEDVRFVVNVVASVAGSIFGIASGFGIDLTLGTD